MKNIMRKVSLLLFLFPLLIAMNSCNDEENSNAEKMSDQVILIIDNDTQAPRSEEPLLIISYGNDGKVAYKRVYITDKKGQLDLKLERGKYRAEFAYISGKEPDNFLEFDVDNSTPRQLIMPIFDKRDYYDCTLLIIDTETLQPRINEPVIFASLNENDTEISAKTLITDSNGKISFHVVAGKYRAKFGYESSDEIDNTFDFSIKPDGDKNIVMSVKSSSLDDRKPIGYTYFEDNFHWVTSDFGGSDYMNGDFPTTETYIANIKDPYLLNKINAAGWTFDGVVSFRLGYIKFGSASKVNSSKGTITTFPLVVDAEKYTNVKIKVKVARYLTKAGGKDAENFVTVSLAGNGSFSRSSALTFVTLPATNEAYNEWVELEAIAYNVSSNTTISIGKANLISVGRFFLGDVSITKDSKAEIE